MASSADLIIRLSHELGCVLELTCTPVEMKEMWAEGLDALADAKQYLADNGLPAPGVVDNVLRVTTTIPAP